MKCASLLMCGLELFVSDSLACISPRLVSVALCTYLQYLQELLPEYMEDVPLDTRELDEAPPHFTIAIRRNLYSPNRWVGTGGAIVGPPRSLDITPPDFWLWCHIKSMAYATLDTKSYFGSDGIGYSFLRVPVGGCDFSMRYYEYDDNHAGDAQLKFFNLTDEDFLRELGIEKQQDLAQEPGVGDHHVVTSSTTIFEPCDLDLDFWTLPLTLTAVRRISDSEPGGDQGIYSKILGASIADLDVYLESQLPANRDNQFEMIWSRMCRNSYSKRTIGSRPPYLGNTRVLPTTPPQLATLPAGVQAGNVTNANTRCACNNKYETVRYAINTATTLLTRHVEFPLPYRDAAFDNIQLLIALNRFLTRIEKTTAGSHYASPFADAQHGLYTEQSNSTTSKHYALQLVVTRAKRTLCTDRPLMQTVQAYRREHGVLLPPTTYSRSESENRIPDHRLSPLAAPRTLRRLHLFTSLPPACQPALVFTLFSPGTAFLMCRRTDQLWGTYAQGWGSRIEDLTLDDVILRSRNRHVGSRTSRSAIPVT
ncbi:hypothetical protein PR048_020877 [Dryococelus australis]|uniref:Glucosylceramidase n=1 Tax=Dryococelus australis TaxID=614101 RepID=A0ABQ9GWN1_9NEOP|nr:hypothetical protein PR048_020877 [Dryococelus australis]